MLEDKNQISKLIEYSFLFMTYISTMSCMVRTDFNFAFAFFGYYLWISRDDKANAFMLMILNGILIIADAIWFLAVGRVWKSDLQNPLWNDISGIHSWAIFWSIINIISKLGVIGLIQLFRTKSSDQQNYNTNPGQQIGGYTNNN